MTPKRVMSMPASSALNVCPFSANSASSSARRVGSASALKTASSSMASPYVTKRSHIKGGNARALQAVAATMTTIGFIGAGNIGGTVARLAVDAGYEVVLSNSRGPETLADLTADLGPSARAATPAEAAAA